MNEVEVTAERHFWVSQVESTHRALGQHLAS